MKVDTILYVTDHDLAARGLAGRLQALGCDLLIARESLAPAVLFINRHINVVVLDETGSKPPNPSLARLIKTLRPDVKIIAIATAPDENPEYIDTCIPPSGQSTPVELVLKEVA